MYKPTAEDMLDYLAHYGMPRRSGRYPWGSGEDPYQHASIDFLGRYEEYKNKGLSEKEIAKEMSIVNEKGEPSTGRLRLEKQYAVHERRLLDIARAKSIQDDIGYKPTEIGRRMGGLSESTVRSLLNPDAEARTLKSRATADFLRERLKEDRMIDVGVGVERELKISAQKLEEALFILQKEGCHVYKGGIPQATNAGKQINQKVLTLPEVEHKEIYEFDKVKSLKPYVSHDGGETFDKFVYPKSMDSKRIKIRYAEEGGVDKDGIVEIRRGVDDLSLGNDHYSQVRILVDNTHYIKGMAVYSDNMPDGVDIIFNTNKGSNKSKHEVLKEIKNDPDNPFGSLIKPGGQSYYTDKDGNRQLSLINKRSSEGDWSEWKDKLPSQFLGKQALPMIKKQLNLAKVDKLSEFQDIKDLNNPTVKKHLLQKFADECDAAAVDLQAAALPGQKYHVIIPVNTLKDTEIYAPRYENGTKLALIRYPHGGTFEIPVLTVNNRHKNAKDLIGADSIDAVGITKKNADRLSGADFDGDTVMCIPTDDPKGRVKVTRTQELDGLKGFDPKDSYQYSEMRKDADGVEHYYRNGSEFRVMRNTGTEMGKISNLITDMTLLGAKEHELARAVRHSMVVIDAEKHKLDYKQSEIDNDIASLRKKYQQKPDGGKPGGASTILSKSKGQASVPKRQGTAKINQKGKDWYDPTKEEGALIWKNADDLYYPVRSYNKKTGKITITTTDKKKVEYDVSDPKAREQYEPIKVTDPDGTVRYTNKSGTIEYKTEMRTQASTKMASTDDAYTLVSSARHPKELAYADYANSMKHLANEARMEIIRTGKIEYSKQAAEVYKSEVSSLKVKLNDALLNAPREREAQRRTNASVAAKLKENPDMKTKDLKKVKQQTLTSSRSDVDAISRRKRNIDITDREWEAIQAGAISESKLVQILNNTDTAALRQRATPKNVTTLSTAKQNKIKQMARTNYSLEDIAKSCGCSVATVSKYLKGAN